MANEIYHIGQVIYNNSNQVAENTNLLPDNIKVIKMGINTIPGTKFIFNEVNEGDNDQKPVIEIGRTGFFELDLKDLGMHISSITIPSGDTTSVNNINNNYCYIDYVYYTDDGN